MKAEPVIKSSQEQAVASWINYLNQLRLDRLVEKLIAQDINFEQAMAELQKMKQDIAELIFSNRGGVKGLHGFIAEAAEVAIENAKNLIKGLEGTCKWLNNNGPADLLRNTTEIQQKFVRAGGHFGLEAIKKHLEKYPDFLKNGGKYQIPKDFYEELQRLMSLSPEEAAKGPTSTYRLWKWVHIFFDENDIQPSDLEPSNLKYVSAQPGKINDTIKAEEENIRKEDKKIRKEAYEESKPSLQEGAQAAAVSALFEGGITFFLSIAQKRKQGKTLSEFTEEDWKEVGVTTGKGAGKGAIRGSVIYLMSNYTATPAAIASGLVTAAFGVVGQAQQLRQGTITEEDFIINSEVLCLDVSVSSISSLLGQTLIPIPVLGAIIGNMAGMFMYGIAKEYLSDKEQKLIQNYREKHAALVQMLGERYQKLIAQLEKELAKYTSLLEFAFDLDANVAFCGSVTLADYVGVVPDRVLRSKTDIDRYFLD